MAPRPLTYAFIDRQSRNPGIQRLGSKLDLRRFLVFLETGPQHAILQLSWKDRILQRTPGSRARKGRSLKTLFAKPLETEAKRPGYHVISVKALHLFWGVHPDAEEPLRRWGRRVAKEATWKNLEDVKAMFSRAEAVRLKDGRNVTIFNVGGNKYRIITAIHYNRRKIYILRGYTHAEYDRINWKEQLSRD